MMEVDLMREAVGRATETVWVLRMKRLSDSELENAKRNLREARVSLACEALVLSDEQEALFRSFEDERLPHVERRRRIMARYSGRGDTVEAAE